MATTAIFPGSFDPVTLGHLDVIERAAGLFDRVVVGVLDNPGKSSLFSVEERQKLIEAEISSLQNVDVDSFNGLTVEFAAKVDADWIVRGVRSGADAEYELPMAHSNRVCGKRSVDTLLIPTSPSLAFISSTLVRQIAKGGGELSPFVGAGVAEAIRAKLG